MEEYIYEKYSLKVPSKRWILVQLCLSLPELVRLQLRECQIETVSGIYHHDDEDDDAGAPSQSLPGSGPA